MIGFIGSYVDVIYVHEGNFGGVARILVVEWEERDSGGIGWQVQV